MEIIKTTNELKNFRSQCEGSVGLVPTMGALHEGHLSLIQKSVEQNDITIVSVFVNPTQFLEGEDLDAYPKQTEADLEICRRAGVSAVFLPESKEMYGEDEPFMKAPKISGFVLEGERRPGHFDGVLSVVLKLLNLARPNKAYFGKKDAQQLHCLEKMVSAFHLPYELVPCEIVRSSEGLALSSRNAYLSEAEKIEALKLSRSLKIASEMIVKNEKNSQIIKQEMLKILEPLKVDYVEIVSRDFRALNEVELGNTIVLVAAFVGKARLIDNMWV